MSPWPLVPLGSVLRIRSEIVHPRDKPAGSGRFVGLEHIEPHTGRRIGELEIRLEELTGRKARFHPGDIVYGYLRPYLNKVWVADFDGFCSVDQYVFKVDERVGDPSFFSHFLRSDAYLSQAPIDTTPGQLPRIRSNEILSVQVELPPREMQRMLASKVAAQLAAAHTARSAAAARRLTAVSLRAAAYRSLLAGSEFDSWPSATIASLLASPLRTGVSGAPSTTSAVRGLSLAAVRRGRLDLTQSRPVAVDPSTDRLVREGRFYVVRGNGRLDLVGRAGLAPRSDAHVVFPDLLIEMHMDPTKVHPEYLQLIWDGREVRSDIESRARTASGIHKINLGNLAQVVVPLPPMETQRRIGSELRSRLDAIDTAVAATNEELEAIEALPAALLRRAFTSVA